MTPLPAFAAFVDEVARAVGGEAVTLTGADVPAAVVRLGASCVVLVRAHVSTFVVSLPVTHSWSVNEAADWAAALPEVERALAAHRPIVSMSDVVMRLSPPWEVSFPGVPLPTEATLFRGARTVQLSQNATSVTIAVWEGSTKHTRELTTIDALDDVASWVEKKVALQARLAQTATATLAEEAARRAAIPPPDFAQVMAAFRDGQSIQIGGGRSFPTYAMKAGHVVVIQSDDGYTEEHSCDDASLRAAVAENAEIFRQWVERWLATKAR